MGTNGTPPSARPCGTSGRRMPAILPNATRAATTHAPPLRGPGPLRPPPWNQGGPPCSSPASPPGPRQGWAAGSDRFWLLELRVSRTFLFQLRPQLFRKLILKSIRCKDLRLGSGKHSVNPPASVQRVPCPRPRPRLAVGSVIGIPRRNLTMRRGYDVSGAGTSSSHPHARLCSGLRFHGRNRSTSSTARPPAWAHASR